MVFEYQNVEFFEFRSDIRRDHRRVCPNEIFELGGREIKKQRAKTKTLLKRICVKHILIGQQIRIQREV